MLGRIALALGVFGFLSMDGYANSVSADAPTATLAKTYLHWFLPALMLQFPLISMGAALRATSSCVTSFPPSDGRSSPRRLVHPV